MQIWKFHGGWKYDDVTLVTEVSLTLVTEVSSMVKKILQTVWQELKATFAKFT